MKINVPDCPSIYANPGQFNGNYCRRRITNYEFYSDEYQSSCACKAYAATPMRAPSNKKRRVVEKQSRRQASDVPIDRYISE